MGTKKKTEKFNKLLQKYFRHQDYVKFYFDFFGEEETLSGFILAMTDDFFLIRTDGEFDLDGYAIITQYDFKSLRSNKYDKTQKLILKQEGHLDGNYGHKEPINLSSWQTIFDDLKALDYHVIVQSVEEKNMSFKIGPLIKITKKKIQVMNYDPTGKLDKKPTSIINNDIRIVKFGDNYSTVFRKYLR